MVSYHYATARLLLHEVSPLTLVAGCTHICAELPSIMQSNSEHVFDVQAEQSHGDPDWV